MEQFPMFSIDHGTQLITITITTIWRFIDEIRFGNNSQFNREN